ncbi:peptidase U35 [Klebsiella pneumoniae]|nr:peptidase U35 [Klebsiella pneumoniae]
MYRKNAAMKVKAFDFDIKAVNDDGLFSGYGSVFDVVDSYNEVVAPGAFLESIEETRAKGRTFPVLWQHRTGEPIGNWDITRAITGLSIGYYVRESNYDEKTRIRTLTKLDLVEISIVTVPANDDARIDVIKSKLSHGDLPSLSEFEKFLREAGFSKSQSAAVASRGLSYLLDRSESGGEDGETKAAIAAMRQQLSQFSLPKIL